MNKEMKKLHAGAWAGPERAATAGAGEDAYWRRWATSGDNRMVFNELRKRLVRKEQAK